MLRLAHEVLDKQLKDVHGENAGRVDGVVLELRDGLPPRVAYVEVSPITLIARFSRRLACRYARLDRRFGKGRGVPFRIPWSRVTHGGPTLVVDLAVEATPINGFEDWLRTHVIERIPGAWAK
jgi:hypothetical protein